MGAAKSGGSCGRKSRERNRSWPVRPGSVSFSQNFLTRDPQRILRLPWLALRVFRDRYNTPHYESEPILRSAIVPSLIHHRPPVAGDFPGFGQHRICLCLSTYSSQSGQDFAFRHRGITGTRNFEACFPPSRMTFRAGFNRLRW